jgi:hypothetical protein
MDDKRIQFSLMKKDHHMDSSSAVKHSETARNISTNSMSNELIEQLFSQRNYQKRYEKLMSNVQQYEMEAQRYNKQHCVHHFPLVRYKRIETDVSERTVAMVRNNDLILNSLTSILNELQSDAFNGSIEKYQKFKMRLFKKAKENQALEQLQKQKEELKKQQESDNFNIFDDVDNEQYVVTVIKKNKEHVVLSDEQDLDDKLENEQISGLLSKEEEDRLKKIVENAKRFQSQFLQAKQSDYTESKDTIANKQFYSKERKQTKNSMGIDYENFENEIELNEMETKSDTSGEYEEGLTESDIIQLTSNIEEEQRKDAKYYRSNLAGSSDAVGQIYSSSNMDNNRKKYSTNTQRQKREREWQQIQKIWKRKKSNNKAV